MSRCSSAETKSTNGEYIYCGAFLNGRDGLVFRICTSALICAACCMPRGVVVPFYGTVGLG